MAVLCLVRLVCEEIPASLFTASALLYDASAFEIIAAAFQKIDGAFQAYAAAFCRSVLKTAHQKAASISLKVTATFKQAACFSEKGRIETSGAAMAKKPAVLELKSVVTGRSA